MINIIIPYIYKYNIIIRNIIIHDKYNYNHDKHNYKYI